MYFAVRQNRRKRIPEDKKDTYIALGYTILDEAGNELPKEGAEAEAETKKTSAKKKTATEAAE